MRTKLLKRDYNQELEQIAESKRFDKEAQNLLLSMLYKVENAYDDYELVKREVPLKEDFVQNILNIVKNNFKEIEIAKPNSLLEKELEETKCKIKEEEKEKKVIIFPNERKILYSVIKAGIENIKPDLRLEEKAILSAIQIGRCISYSEVIRDFNGFSWTSVINEIESIECNSIYTNLIYILGEEKLKTINSNNISELKKYIPEELYKEISKVAIKFYLCIEPEERKKLDEKIEKNRIKFAEMSNQVNFIEKATNNKKEMLAKIREIDETLNNPELLRKKYLEKNSTLPNEKKIFSVSHYDEILQNERKCLLEQIEENNKLLKPAEFVKTRSELEAELNYYDNLEKTDIVKMQEEFLKVFSGILKDKNEKLDLLDYIYELRYLNFLPISKEEKMKDKINFKEIEKKVIAKGIELGLITPISNNEDTDYAMLSSIFKTRNPNLEDLSIMLGVEDGKLKSEIYEGEMLDSTNEIDLGRNSNVALRKTKKIKIFN